jgi:short-subunit dehydrogenase
MKLKNKIALITGASRGIGAAVARRYAAEGAHVILVGRTVSGLEVVDDYVKSIGGQATIVPLDLMQHDKIDELGGIIAKRFGRLDVLVGNAGMLGHLSPVGHIEPGVWEKIFSLNLTANYRLIRSFDALLRQASAGRAIFVSSGVTKSAMPYWGAYSASKLALEQLIKVYAAETKKSNLKANLVDPGMVATNMLAEAMPGANMDKFPAPEKITDIFVELALETLQDSGRIFGV